MAGTPAKDATWFDAMTAAAFLLFAQERVEWIVVEVGLGGRLDSTNVIDGNICVITNIALEHTEVLGNTLAEITREKGGIIKNDSIVVTGVGRDHAIHAVIASLAREREAMLVTIDPQTGNYTAKCRACRHRIGPAWHARLTRRCRFADRTRPAG
jgi:dihydrofolate synthase/folylpolyglutamate synthase